ncbi:MAG: ABC transporter ATP-binding protein [Nitrospinae bacterium]|nr:ABC transporter ATP-binding protein [Nitrospinota bacterium]
MGEAAVLECQNVWVHRGDKYVLRAIDFAVPQGSVFGLIGPNGGGKTTLLKVALKLLEPARGEVRLFGKRWEEHPSPGPSVGYTPQHHMHLPQFPVSVRQVVRMGRYGKAGLAHPLTPADKAVVERCLELVGMEAFANRPIDELSGGQKQRVFIARALAGEPQLLLLDEPTAGVDSAARNQFYELLRELQQRLGLTVMLATHDIGMVLKYCRLVGCLNETLTVHDTGDRASLLRHLQSIYDDSHVVFLHEHEA